MNNPTNIRVPTLKTGVHKIEAGNLCVSLEPARSPHKPTYMDTATKSGLGGIFGQNPATTEHSRTASINRGVSRVWEQHVVYR